MITRVSSAVTGRESVSGCDAPLMSNEFYFITNTRNRSNPRRTPLQPTASKTRSATMRTRTTHPITLSHVTYPHQSVSGSAGANTSLLISSQMNERRKYVLIENRSKNLSIAGATRITDVKNRINKRKRFSSTFGMDSRGIRLDQLIAYSVVSNFKSMTYSNTGRWTPARPVRSE